MSLSTLWHHQRGLRRVKRRPGSAVGLLLIRWEDSADCLICWGLVALRVVLGWGTVCSVASRWPGDTGFHCMGQLWLCITLPRTWKLRASPVLTSQCPCQGFGDGGAGASAPSGSCGCFLLVQAEVLLSCFLTPQWLPYEKRLLVSSWAHPSLQFLPPGTLLRVPPNSPARTCTFGFVDSHRPDAPLLARFALGGLGSLAL